MVRCLESEQKYSHTLAHELKFSVTTQKYPQHKY